MTHDAFTIDEVREGLWCIGLHAPEGLEPLIGPRTNVYLSRSPAGPIGLVNTGRGEHAPALLAALAELEVEPDAVDRVLLTTFEPDSVGNVGLFDWADYLMVCPDRKIARNFSRWLGEQRDDLGRYVEHSEDTLELDSDPKTLEVVYPREPATIPVVSLRNGMKIVVGALELEVLTTPGFDQGHALFWSGDVLFSSNIVFDGLPDVPVEVQGYLVALERALNLEPTVALPNRGRPQKRGTWSLQRALRWANNYLSNIGAALAGGVTLTEYLERDLGHAGDTPTTFALQMRRHKPFLDELARTRMVDTAGEGFEVRYGINVDDPRERLRR